MTTPVLVHSNGIKIYKLDDMYIIIEPDNQIHKRNDKDIECEIYFYRGDYNLEKISTECMNQGRLHWNYSKRLNYSLQLDNDSDNPFIDTDRKSIISNILHLIGYKQFDII